MREVLGMKVTVLLGGAELRKSRTAAEPSSRMIVSPLTLLINSRGKFSKLGKLDSGSWMILSAWLGETLAI